MHTIFREQNMDPEPKANTKHLGNMWPDNFCLLFGFFGWLSASSACRPNYAMKTPPHTEGIYLKAQAGGLQKVKTSQ